MYNNQRIVAVEAFRHAVTLARSQSAFARSVGLLQQTVSNLLRRGDLLPPQAVLATEQAYGISRHVLRPDIYPPAEPAVPPPVDATAVEDGAPIVAFDRRAALKQAVCA